MKLTLIARFASGLSLVASTACGGGGESSMRQYTGQVADVVEADAEARRALKDCGGASYVAHTTSSHGDCVYDAFEKYAADNHDYIADVLAATKAYAECLNESSCDNEARDSCFRYDYVVLLDGGAAVTTDLAKAVDACDSDVPTRPVARALR